MLRNSIKDLDIAQRSIEEMAKTTNFDTFVEHWQNYLFRIERAWENVDRTLQKQRGYQQWIKPYKVLRKKDPLLIFLKQARNAETHGITNSVDKPLSLAIRDKWGRGFSPSLIESEFEDGVLTFNINTQEVGRDFIAELLPSDPKIVNVKNRGKRYKVPWSHMKSKIEDIHPVPIAQLGLAFYSGLVSEAENWTKLNK